MSIGGSDGVKSYLLGRRKNARPRGTKNTYLQLFIEKHFRTKYQCVSLISGGLTFSFIVSLDLKHCTHVLKRAMSTELGFEADKIRKNILL